MLAVVYLIFNAGYDGRGELAGEAIRLGGVLASLMPDEPEVHGLLALMLCHDARRASRFADGELVLLADQDRALWDFDADRRGRARARPRAGARGRGPYVLQAAIASLQPRRRSTGRRSWRSTTSSLALTRSPVVELNRAVAVAEAGDVAGALALVDALELDGYRYLHSTRAELLRRLRTRGGARAHAIPTRALSLAPTEPERRLLQRRPKADCPCRFPGSSQGRSQRALEARADARGMPELAFP